MDSSEFFDVSKCYSEAFRALALHKRNLFQERNFAVKSFQRGTVCCGYSPVWLGLPLTIGTIKKNVENIPAGVSDGHGGLVLHSVGVVLPRNGSSRPGFWWLSGFHIHR